MRENYQKTSKSLKEEWEELKKATRPKRETNREKLDEYKKQLENFYKKVKESPENIEEKKEVLEKLLTYNAKIMKNTSLNEFSKYIGDYLNLSTFSKVEFLEEQLDKWLNYAAYSDDDLNHLFDKFEAKPVNYYSPKGGSFIKTLAKQN